jgi:hypothetical protein
MTFLVKVNVTLREGVTERVNVPSENESGSEGSDSDSTSNTCLSRQVRVCGTIRVNRGLPPDLKEESKSLKRGETTFRRKGDILLQS